MNPAWISPPLLILAVATLPAHAATVTEIIDSTGDGIAGLDGAEGVAVDGAGNVYVAGATSDNVFKITPGGVVSEIIDSTGDGVNILDAPFDIDADAAGNVYVAGSGSHNAFKITSGGVITEIIDTTGDGVVPLLAPFGIAVDDATGNVYVSGRDSWNCFEITPAAVITEIIDFTGNGVSPLQQPFGVAVDGASNVYVAGRMSDNAFKITPGGVITLVIDSTGDGGGNPLDCGAFTSCGIAASAAGTVYVTGPSTDNAFKITAGGVITEIIDSTGDGLGNPLDLPQGVAVDDSTGNVYVAGASSDNAFEITSGGAITEVVDSTGDGGGNALDAPDINCVATDGAGTAYVSGFFTDNAFKIEPGAPAVPPAVVTEIIDGAGDGANALVNPDGIDVDPFGIVYVGGCGNSPANSSVFKITPGGVITEILDGTGDGVAVFDCAVGTALDSLGNVYVAGHRSDNVFKVAPDGTVTLVMDDSDGILAPFDIAVDADDNIYVTGFGSDNAFQVTPGGTITEIIDSTGDGVNALDAPFGIAVDTAGNVYVAGNDEDVAFKITPGAWTVTTIIDSTGDGVNALAKVADVEVDGLGNVYVTGNGSDNVFKVEPGGTITEVLDISDGINNPTCVAADTAGSIYVAGFDSDNVTRLTPQGTVTQVLGPAGDGVNGFVGPADDCLAVDTQGNVYATGTLSFHNAFKVEVNAPRLSAVRVSPLGPEPPCVTAGETVTIEVHMSDLDDFEAVEFKAFLSYDDSALNFDSAVYTSSPFGTPTITGGDINPAPGEVDLAAELDVPGGQMPTTDDALLATVTFTAKGVSECPLGTAVDFRAHVPASQIVDDSAALADVILADATPVSIDGVAPDVSDCPPDLDVPADAGACDAAVAWTAPTVTDACDPAPTVEYDIDLDYLGAPGIDDTTATTMYTFPAGTHRVTVRAEDECGNVNDACDFTVVVNAENEFKVSVELAGVGEAALSRCLTFELFECGGGSVVVDATIAFTSGLATDVVLAVPCGLYECVTARDALHTLARTDDDQFGVTPIIANQYVADFTDNSGIAGDDDALIGGNLNDDFVIDILDFGEFVGSFGDVTGGDTPCGVPGPDADISGNGIVFSEEFTFISTNFLKVSDVTCCGASPAVMRRPRGRNLQASQAPVTRISLAQLRQRGLDHLAIADLNGDGWLDVGDMEAFATGAQPWP